MEASPFSCAWRLSELPQLQDTKLDLTVAGFALVASMAAGLLFGLLPALQVSQSDLASGIRQGARGLAGHISSRRFRSVLTVAEMALAMILFTGACLLIRSFERVQQVSLGYDPRNVSIAQVQLPRARYGSDAQSSGVLSTHVRAPRAHTRDPVCRGYHQFLLRPSSQLGFFQH